MTTYTDKMHDLNAAVYDAVRAANDAVKAAQNEDGAPVDAVQMLASMLREAAAETDSVVDHGMSRKDVADAYALYKGAKLAGLTSRPPMPETWRTVP